MKVVYLILILTFFANCSCKKEEAYVPNYDGGFTEVMLNGEFWKGEVEYNIDNLNSSCLNVQSIAFKSRNAFGEVRRSLIFSKVIQDSIGIIELDNVNLNETPCELHVGFYLSVADGDAGDGSFWLDESQENYLEIIHQDDQKIEGIYDLHFIVKDDNPPDAAIHSAFVNGARFENGTFTVFKK